MLKKCMKDVKGNIVEHNHTQNTKQLIKVLKKINGCVKQPADTNEANIK